MRDIAIVGGGPAGSTVGALLKKYAPDLNVSIYERETFPRDHVGESQLPLIGRVLDEMGCWDKVEAAGFPIKIGATYRWGCTDDLWNFEFIPNGDLQPEPRPARYVGQRKLTAFQVDRSVYDKILLDHAREVGCVVRESCEISEVATEGDRITSLRTESGEQITADVYVDCTGHRGTLRRSLGVGSHAPTSLRNVAVWDYWRNARWAEEIGNGGTRVQVLSLGWGWIWFIPVGLDRTSIGLIVPADYLKSSQLRLADLYARAVAEDPVVSELIRGATQEGRVATTKDWSFLAERLAGDNWFLAGESAGFADPILAAGMTLAHMGAREVAYTILELQRGKLDAQWLRDRYDEGHRQKIRQHIRFADFWYSANGQFSDLKEYTKQIAQDAGLDLSSDAAWAWLGTGGFVDHDVAATGFGGYSLPAVKQIAGSFLGTAPLHQIVGMNVFELDASEAEQSWGAVLEKGHITRHPALHRNGRYLPLRGMYGLLAGAMKPRATGAGLFQALHAVAKLNRLDPGTTAQFFRDGFYALESMVNDGWVRASLDPTQPSFEAPDDNHTAVFTRAKPLDSGQSVVSRLG